MPAAVFSLAGWSLAYYGLKLTSPSSYSILRGTVIIFTGIGSSLFLKRQLSWKKWVSLCIIFAGLVIVGMADIPLPAHSASVENEELLRYQCLSILTARISTILEMSIRF